MPLFLPFDLIKDRVDRDRENSDTAYFLSVLYYGEAVLKATVLGMVSGLVDDVDRLRYRQLHKLVRADGLGVWPEVLDDVLSGPTSQSLRLAAQGEQRELMNRVSEGWQFECVRELHEVAQVLGLSSEPLPKKVDGRRFGRLLTDIRNATRGHGATPTEQISQIGPRLERAIDTFVLNFSLFKRQWAYLHRNLSGKYRVTSLTESTQEFTYLKSDRTKSFSNGVHVFWEQPVPVELIESNPDALDFYFPNGKFTDATYEAISYSSGQVLTCGSKTYTQPASELPRSETEGKSELESIGGALTNLPPTTPHYVSRQTLESELLTVLRDDRHPVITLIGRGGIGKTSLALKVLHQLAHDSSFDIIIWFSSRDIDLLPQGPKIVRPHSLNVDDFAVEYCRLIGSEEKSRKNAVPQLQAALNQSPFGGRMLFVFDNFETVVEAQTTYNWIDAHIRNPNKVLITTRMRSFKGDFPVEVSGMTEDESELLMRQVAGRLGIVNLLDPEYVRTIYHESDGHPYVIKVLLGELAKSKGKRSVERVVADKETILEALFERTYTSLSPAARRVFLTLCSWKSAVPRLAVEAVLLRNIDERIDTESTIDELRQSSLIDSVEGEDANLESLVVPLSALLFGRKKLRVSPDSAAIRADVELLQLLGPAQRTEVATSAVASRIAKLFQGVAELVSEGREALSAVVPMLKYICTKYHPAWLLLARLYEENKELSSSKDALRQYLQGSTGSGNVRVCQELIRLCNITNDWRGEMHALALLSQSIGVTFDTISWAIHRFNFLYHNNRTTLDSTETAILGRDLLSEAEGNWPSSPTSDDFRNMAWLCVNLKDQAKAREYASKGYALDPDDRWRSLMER